MEKIFEVIMAKNVPKLMTDTKIHIQETQKTPKISTKKCTPRPILLKLQKTKNKEEIKTNEN